MRSMKRVAALALAAAVSSVGVVVFTASPAMAGYYDSGQTSCSASGSDLRCSLTSDAATGRVEHFTVVGGQQNLVKAWTNSARTTRTSSHTGNSVRLEILTAGVLHKGSFTWYCTRLCP